MNRLFRRCVVDCAVFLCAAVIVPPSLSAQSSISDAEIVPRGRTWLSMDYMRVPNSLSERGWSLYGSRYSVGVDDGLELGLGAAWLPGDDVQPLAATTGAKWRMLEQDNVGVSAAIGGTAFLPLSAANRAIAPWGMLFGTLERSFGERAPTASLGAYTLVGQRDVGESRAGFMMSLAQPVTPAVELSVDWVTGDNWFGYLSPGATFSRGAYSLWLGYSRGTHPRGNSGPSMSVGIEL